MARRVWVYAKLTVQASAAGLVADQHRDKRKRRIEKRTLLMWRCLFVSSKGILVMKKG